MKVFFIFISLFLSFQVFGQITIKGEVVDAKTHEPLAFTNVMYQPQKGVVADFDGNFVLVLPDNVKQFYVTYVGYQRKVINIVPQKKHYKILLQPTAESLGTVVISSKYVNPAIALIKHVVKEKKHNDYRKKLSKYAFTKYFKFLVAADTKAIKNPFDSIYKDDKLVRIDSSLYDLKNKFADKDMFLIESVSKVNGGSGKEKTNIVATRTSGLKNPLYELLAIQTSGRNVYDDNYKFLFSKYLGPLTNRSIKQYKYEIEDTIQFQNRKIVIVSYRNTLKPLISGQIYIDAKSLAITKLTLNTFKAFELKTTHYFKYYAKHNVWFPERSQMYIKKSDDKNNVSFAGGAVFIGSKQRNDSLKHSNNKSDLDYTFASSNTKLSNILLGQHYTEKIDYDLQVAPMAHKRSAKFWQKYKSTVLLKRDLKTYKFIDSSAQADHFERDLSKMKVLLTGYYPLGKVDLNFSNLFSYNRYEGFRVQLGGKTNENLSDKFSLSGYLAYGFRDKDVKYNGKIKYKLNHNKQTYINVSYFKDLQKSGTFSTLPYTQFALKMQHFTDDKYYMSRGFRFDIEYLISPHLWTNISYQLTQDDVKHNIPFHEGRKDFALKDDVSLQTDFIFTPYSKYMLTPSGRKVVSDNYPKFYLHFEKNIPQWQTDKSDYFRIDLQTYFKKIYLNKNYSSAVIRLGFASQGASLHKMYMPNSNGVNGTSLLKRFSPAANFSFQTMNDLSFADNFVSSLHLSHTFARLKWSKNKTFDISVLGSAAWGISFDNNKYLGIQSLNSTYYETGIEFRRLYSGIGLGFYYRLGDYAQPEFIDNMAIKITLNPFKLFGK